MEKLKKNKEILRDPAFKEQFKGIQVQDLLFDIIEEILWIARPESQNMSPTAVHAITVI